MRKNYVMAAFFAVSLMAVSIPIQAQGWLGALATAAQALTLSNSQIQAYTRQYIQQLDAKSTICGTDDPYTIRLNRLTANLKSIDGTPLNFKVYKTSELNAFACADGSVRVYSGLMDILNDDELLGVIGHELGHVAHQDTKNQYKRAILTAAATEGLAASNSTIATLSQSTLGKIGQALASSSFSRKQEAAADDFGYEFLKGMGKNPWAMATSFEKLKAHSGSGQASITGFVNQLFSDHPDLDHRIQTMESRAIKDGYKEPSVTTTFTGATAGTARSTARTAIATTTASKQLTSSSKRTATKKKAVKKTVKTTKKRTTKRK